MKVYQLMIKYTLILDHTCSHPLFYHFMRKRLLNIIRIMVIIHSQLIWWIKYPYFWRLVRGIITWTGLIRNWSWRINILIVRFLGILFIFLMPWSTNINIVSRGWGGIPWRLLRLPWRKVLNSMNKNWVGVCLAFIRLCLRNWKKCWGSPEVAWRHGLSEKGCWLRSGELKLKKWGGRRKSTWEDGVISGQLRAYPWQTANTRNLTAFRFTRRPLRHNTCPQNPKKWMTSGTPSNYHFASRTKTPR